MLAATLSRGTLLTVGALILCVFGIIAVLRVPVQMIPDLDVRTVTVQTIWPGATPQDVEKELVIEQEEYLRNIPGLRRMVSLATTGEARIELEFPFGVDINEALVRVNNALSQVPDYPENVDEPRLFTTSFSNNAFLYFRIAPLPGNPAGLNMDAMLDFIDDNVRTRIERVPGVSQAEMRGGARRQVQIHVDAARLAERGITLEEVRDAIRARNRDVSGGDLDSGKRRYLLRTVGRFEDLAALEDLILRRQGDALVRLGDVAQVRLHHFEVRARPFVNGEPIITLSVRRTTGANVIAVKDAVMAAVDDLNRGLLQASGMQMALTTDDVRYVEAAVRSVWVNLALGAALASVVMLLFLRSVPATLLAVAGIPICTIAAFIGLLAAGRTINVISLAGIAFAIGMTVDNTIVVLERIERAQRRLAPFAAALAAVREVWPAVLASTLTTVLVFAPVLFVREEAGQLYSDIAIAIASSILVSMLVAVTLVPALAARMVLGGATGPERPAGRIAPAVARLIATRPRRLVVIAATLALTAGMLWTLTPPTEYLPEGEEPKAFSSMIAPPGYSLTEMSGIAQRLHREFLPYVDDDPARHDRGESPVPALSVLMIWVQPQQLRVIAETRDPAHIDAWIDVIDAHFRQYPGMRAFSSRGSIISSNDGGTRAVNVDIAGSDLASIYAVALAVFERAHELFDAPQVRPDPPSLALGQPLIELHPRWERAAELGLDAGGFGYAIAALTDGAYVDEYFLADDKVDIFLYSAAGPWQRLEDVPNLPVYVPGGAVLPVSALADIVETVDTETIRRVNGRRTVTLSIIAPRAVALETAVARVEQDLVGRLRADGVVPASVSLDISGAADQLTATRAALSGNFAIALVLCYLLLVAIFSHWGHPLLIMTTVPVGIGGGIAGLALLNAAGATLPVFGLPAIHQPLDMITMLGFLILVGTVVNNPILIVDQALRNRAAGATSALEAVQSAVASRLRPLLMTTTTTICGLAPLVFLPGAGTELYRGIGAVVLFGLFFAGIVTLTFLPALVVEAFDLGAALRRVRVPHRRTSGG